VEALEQSNSDQLPEFFASHQILQSMAKGVATFSNVNINPIRCKNLLGGLACLLYQTPCEEVVGPQKTYPKDSLSRYLED